MMNNRGMYDHVTYEDTGRVRASYALRQMTMDTPNSTDEWDLGQRGRDFVDPTVRSPPPQSRLSGSRDAVEYRQRLREFEAHILQGETDYYAAIDNFQVLKRIAVEKKFNLAMEILKLENKKSNPRKTKPRKKYTKESLYRIQAAVLDKEEKQMLELERAAMMEAALLERIKSEKAKLSDHMEKAKNKFLHWAEKRQEKRDKLEAELQLACSEMNDHIQSSTFHELQAEKTVRSVMLAESAAFADIVPDVNQHETRKKISDLVKFFEARKINLSAKFESANFMTVITTKERIENGKLRLPVSGNKEPTVLATGFGNSSLDSLVSAVDNVTEEMFRAEPPHRV